MGLNVVEQRMDTKGARRMSLKRLSTRVDGFMQKMAAKKRSSFKRIPSDVSELKETRGPALHESNALNDEGIRIIDNITQTLENRLAEENRLNDEDAFSRGKVPPVSLFDYFSRMARYVNVWRGHAGGSESAGVRAAVMVIMYLERLETVRPDYVVNPHNIHRLCMAGFLVATKFTEDQPISNEFWARVGGVMVQEVNQLESAFCKLFDFELYIDDSEYLRYLDQFDMPFF